MMVTDDDADADTLMLLTDDDILMLLTDVDTLMLLSDDDTLINCLSAIFDYLLTIYPLSISCFLTMKPNL